MRRTAPNALDKLPHQKADFIEPMDCAPVSKLSDGSQWLFEIKLDGYRAIAVKADGRVNLFSRRRKLFDHHYPLIVEALADLPEGTVVDGEVVALDESGRPNFNLLQNFRSEASRIHYFIFDLLICQDRDLTSLPLTERRVMPFANLPDTHKSRWGDELTAEKMKECIWLHPKGVAQVEFLEWTAGDRLRHSKFAGLREDKDARQVVKERAKES